MNQQNMPLSSTCPLIINDMDEADEHLRRRSSRASERELRSSPPTLMRPPPHQFPSPISRWQDLPIASSDRPRQDPAKQCHETSPSARSPPSIDDRSTVRAACCELRRTARGVSDGTSAPDTDLREMQILLLIRSHRTIAVMIHRQPWASAKSCRGRYESHLSLTLPCLLLSIVISTIDLRRGVR